jgi:hypothetical protein
VTPEAPVKHGRGRPPGSRSRKPSRLRFSPEF